MHNNCCISKWHLAANSIVYIHNSARFYLTSVQGIYAVTNFMEMEEVDLQLRFDKVAQWYVVHVSDTTMLNL